MGAFLDKPKTEKHTMEGKGNDLRYALSYMQGWRTDMEDAHTAVVELPGHMKEWSFFGVFDGHAGCKVANYSAEQLLYTLLDLDTFKSPNLAIKPEKDIEESIRTGFLLLDDQLRTEFRPSNYHPMSNGNPRASQETIFDHSGSTAICVFVSPQSVIMANCGDSRAILVRNGNVIFSTQDHKPGNPLEKARIERAGGSVLIQRVNGSLAVSRSLGDFDYKGVENRNATEQLVTAEPDVTTILRRPGEDELLIMACDGIWDVMTNAELCDFVRARMRVHDNLAVVCNEVIDTCLHKGSRDNMSVIIVAFPAAPRPTVAAQEADRMLNDTITNKVINYCRMNPNVESPVVFEYISNEHLSNIPPGGGLYCKRELINQLVQENTVKSQHPT